MLKKAPADSIRTGFVALSAVGFPFLEEHAAICLSTDLGDKFFLNTALWAQGEARPCEIGIVGERYPWHYYTTGLNSQWYAHFYVGSFAFLYYQLYEFK